LYLPGELGEWVLVGELRVLLFAAGLCFRAATSLVPAFELIYFAGYLVGLRDFLRVAASFVAVEEFI
jgi:hypothetical protein